MSGDIEAQGIRSKRYNSIQHDSKSRARVFWSTTFKTKGVEAERLYDVEPVEVVADDDKTSHCLR